MGDAVYFENVCFAASSEIDVSNGNPKFSLRNFAAKKNL